MSATCLDSMWHSYFMSDEQTPSITTDQILEFYETVQDALDDYLEECKQEDQEKPDITFAEWWAKGNVEVPNELDHPDLPPVDIDDDDDDDIPPSVMCAGLRPKPGPPASFQIAPKSDNGDGHTLVPA